MKHSSLIKLLLIIVIVILPYSVMYKIDSTEEKVEQAYVVGYKIFDVIFREKYYDGCWSNTDKELEEYYAMDGHYKTSQYALLSPLMKDSVDIKHKHFDEQWEKCK